MKFVLVLLVHILVGIIVLGIMYLFFTIFGDYAILATSLAGGAVLVFFILRNQKKQQTHPTCLNCREDTKIVPKNNGLWSVCPICKEWIWLRDI